MLLLLVSAALQVQAMPAGDLVDHYASKYDHIDVESILNNKRMVSYYTACLLSQGPCPPEGLEFKRILPEALQTNCVRCTEKQKAVTLRTIRRLKKEYPKIWKQLADQWDPQDVFVSKFESTFGTRYASEEPTFSPAIINRFAEDEDTENEIFTTSKASTTTKQTFVDSSASSSIQTSTIATRITSTTAGSTSRLTTTTSRPITTARTTSSPTPTNKPNTINTVTVTKTPVKSTKAPVRLRPNIGANIGANIQATVSLGTNIVGGLVRGIGALGTRVVETGAEIAGVVLKNFARPL